MELITGPVHGFYLACYTVQRDEGHYAYAKVCPSRPETVWQAADVIGKIAVGPIPEEVDALLALVSSGTRRLALRLQQPEQIEFVEALA